jgi:hypothetical protein
LIKKFSDNFLTAKAPRVTNTDKEGENPGVLGVLAVQDELTR